jgi:hypothetical protein
MKVFDILTEDDFNQPVLDRGSEFIYLRRKCQSLEQQVNAAYTALSKYRTMLSTEYNVVFIPRMKARADANGKLLNNLINIPDTIFCVEDNEFNRSWIPQYIKLEKRKQALESAYTDAWAKYYGLKDN